MQRYIIAGSAQHPAMIYVQIINVAIRSSNSIRQNRIHTTIIAHSGLGSWRNCLRSKIDDIEQREIGFDVRTKKLLKNPPRPHNKRTILVIIYRPHIFIMWSDVSLHLKLDLVVYFFCRKFSKNFVCKW